MKSKVKDIFAKKRQFGSETNLVPLPSQHERPSTLKLAMGKVAIVATIVCWILYILSIILRKFIEGQQTYDFTMEAFGYTTVVTFLIFSALMYLIAGKVLFKDLVNTLEYLELFLKNSSQKITQV